ncbi:hypothetical protein ABE493_15675 [Stenotrophomonas terrae]|uniref:hypothetical protein n=1 Tax=Stenotrophomonas terrae TaxID=405446 RepID=UPI0032081A15
MEQILTFEIDDFSAIVNDVSVPVHLGILKDSSGYFLVSSSPLGGDSFNGDTWHISVADAFAQAQMQFGVLQGRWRMVAA